MKKLIQKIAYIFRGLLGINKLTFKIDSLKNEMTTQNYRLNKEIKSQTYQLNKAISYIQHLNIENNKIKESIIFQNFHEIISLFSPMDISNATYRRVGRDYDGGYVMLDDFSSDNTDAAYSFGISDDVSWDEEIAKLGINIFMYDHTIYKLPKENKHFKFFKQGVTGKPEVGLETLSNLIAINGHEQSDNLIMKMDIEGYEWSVFEETKSEVIGQFSQIVIEFHGLSPHKSKESLSRISYVLNKINQTHQSVHVHANGHTEVNWLGDWAIPQLLEVTYIRRKDYQDRFIKNTRSFPTKIDQPTFPWLPEVPLGRFSTEYESILFNK